MKNLWLEIQIRAMAFLSLVIVAFSLLAAALASVFAPMAIFKAVVPRTIDLLNEIQKELEQ